jgi:hypothetical protein
MLPDDPAERAYDCGIAVMASDHVHGDSWRVSFEAASRAAQFDGLKMVAQAGGKLDADHPAKSWDEATGKLMTARALLLFRDHKSSEVVAICDAAYPQTLETFPVKLPDDAEDRMLTCNGLAYWMLSRGYPAVDKSMSYPQLKDYVALWERLKPMWHAAMDAHGLKSGPEMARLALPPLGRAFELGRSDKVLDACVLAYPRNPA